MANRRWQPREPPRRTLISRRAAVADGHPPAAMRQSLMTCSHHSGLRVSPQPVASFLRRPVVRRTILPALRGGSTRHPSTPERSAIVIKLDHVGKTYGTDVQALDDVSVQSTRASSSSSWASPAPASRPSCAGSPRRNGPPRAGSGWPARSSTASPPGRCPPAALDRLRLPGLQAACGLDCPARRRSLAP